MYVRWKKQKRSKMKLHDYFLDSVKNSHRQLEQSETVLLSAYLVESERIEGKPRQKILAYLGSINDAERAYISAVGKFWESVSLHLKPLHLTGEQNRNIKEKLQSRVPPYRHAELCKYADLVRRHPNDRRGKNRDFIEEYRKAHNLPGDEIR